MFRAGKWQGCFCLFVCIFYGKDSALMVMHNLYMHDCKFLFFFFASEGDA